MSSGLRAGIFEFYLHFSYYVVVPLGKSHPSVDLISGPLNLQSFTTETYIIVSTDVNSMN